MLLLGFMRMKSRPTTTFGGRIRFSWGSWCVSPFWGQRSHRGQVLKLQKLWWWYQFSLGIIRFPWGIMMEITIGVGSKIIQRWNFQTWVMGSFLPVDDAGQHFGVSGHPDVIFTDFGMVEGLVFPVNYGRGFHIWSKVIQRSNSKTGV